MRTIVIGTRGSRLALAQVEEVRALLAATRPDLRTEVVEITTGGDRDRTSSLSVIGGRGVFVKEIEVALLAGEIDLAVHSLKDMPTTEPDGLVLAAIPARASPFDAAYIPGAQSLGALPDGAPVATSSPRRAAQIRHAYPNLEIVDIRGNVDTRLRKVDEGHAAALIVAKAGLDRLGLGDRATESLDAAAMLPAPGQGALACQVRTGDGELIAALRAIDDAATRAEVEAERAFLRAFGSGCTTPIAALGRVKDATLRLEGLVISHAGTEAVRQSIEGPAGEPLSLGAALAKGCLAAGAAALIEARE